MLLNSGCGRRLLRVPWTTRRSNQSILMEINPKHSLKGLMVKLKLRYFGYLMWRANSLEKTLMLGKIEGKRRRGRQTTRRLASITNSMDMNLSKLQETVEDKGAWRAVVHGVAKSQTWLSDWTTTTTTTKINCPCFCESVLYSWFCTGNLCVYPFTNTTISWLL